MLAAGPPGGRAEWVHLGPVHLVVIGLIVLGCLNLAYFRRELRGVRLDVVLAAGLVLLHLAKVAVAVRGSDDVTDLLPLHTCYAAMVLAVVWCFVKPRWLGEVLVLWAFCGGVIAMLAPDVFGHPFQSFPVVQTLAYHAILLWLGLEIWLVEGLRPSWRSALPTVLVTAALFPAAIVANDAYGTNYLFLTADPGGWFAHLDGVTGPARVAATAATGVALMLVALALWIALDRAGRRFVRKGGAEREEPHRGRPSRPQERVRSTR
jgi:hypothetical integral membrane protein (TIGR02206 family)